MIDEVAYWSGIEAMAKITIWWWEYLLSDADTPAHKYKMLTAALVTCVGYIVLVVYRLYTLHYQVPSHSQAELSCKS